MKKLTLICLAFACVLSLAACKGDGESGSSADPSSSVLSFDESSEEKLDTIALTLQMIPYLEQVDSVEDIPSNSQSPWSGKTELDTLPVMKKGDKVLTTLDATQKANEIAMALGLTIGSASVQPSADGGFMVGLSCAEGLQSVSVSVNEMGEVWILYLHGGKAVPDEYKNNKSAWLIDTYAPLFIGGETVKYGDGDFCAVYEKGKSDKENLTNYFFNSLSFAEDLNLDTVSMQMTHTGTLQRVTAKCADYYDAVDYPVISTDTAKELLAEGKCYTRTTAKADKERVVSTALIYDVNGINDTHIPYYCFWVEAEENGKTCYCPYYVPAIADEYLDTAEADSVMNS